MMRQLSDPPRADADVDFDKVARVYRWFEYLSFGGALQRCRLAQMARMLSARHALVLGDGDGRFTAALLAGNRQVSVVALDSSAAMLSLLAARARDLGASGRLTTVQGDALRLLALAGSGPDLKGMDRPGSQPSGAHDVLWPREGFDLVVSHFFLDCFSTGEVERLADGVLPRLVPGALWVVSEFDTPVPWTRWVVACLYKAFRLLTGLGPQTMPLYEEALAMAGCVCVETRPSLRGLLKSTAWQTSRPSD